MHDLIYLERSGAIYRGYRSDAPMEYWNEAMQVWQPYKCQGPVPLGWAREVSAEEALAFMKTEERNRRELPQNA
ncbi:MAG TPA: hypothetical protein VGR19_00345 [Allosphingosinicella sp.]|nr:hypothetical protein [Allosphingosinicella sp.]